MLSLCLVIAAFALSGTLTLPEAFGFMILMSFFDCRAVYTGDTGTGVATPRGGMYW